MYSCGEIGKCRADDILLRVPLRLHEQNSDVKVDSRIRAGEVVGVLKDVNATCFEYRRENVRRTVCRVSFSVVMQASCNDSRFLGLDCGSNSGFPQ
jgi:nuclear pore complex protein Nup85